jgi:hypothetical protein
MSSFYSGNLSYQFLNQQALCQIFSDLASPLDGRDPHDFLFLFLHYFFSYDFVNFGVLDEATEFD